MLIPISVSVSCLIIGIMIGVNFEALVNKRRIRKKEDEEAKDLLKRTKIKKLYIPKDKQHEFFEKYDQRQKCEGKLYTWAFWKFVQKLFPAEMKDSKKYSAKPNVDFSIKPYIEYTTKEE